MIICRGAGTLLINLGDGDVQWVEAGTPAEASCQQAGYKEVDALAVALHLEVLTVTPPPCVECIHYAECCTFFGDATSQRDMCYGIDEAAVSSGILRGMAAVEVRERNRLLEISDFHGYRSSL